MWSVAGESELLGPGKKIERSGGCDAYEPRREESQQNVLELHSRYEGEQAHNDGDNPPFSFGPIPGIGKVIWTFEVDKITALSRTQVFVFLCCRFFRTGWFVSVEGVDGTLFNVMV